MKFKDYEIGIDHSIFYPRDTQIASIQYLVIGLSEECGETCGKVKKIIRDKNCEISEESKKGLLLECSDTLWYLTRLIKELGSSLEEVAQMNIDKLKDRAKRNQIKGSGDNR